jgi:hypothetical protein
MTDVVNNWPHMRVLRRRLRAEVLKNDLSIDVCSVTWLPDGAATATVRCTFLVHGPTTKTGAATQGDAS